MKIHAVLSNANHPEYGQVTVPFPIQRADYGHVLELLAPLELGDAVKQDCKVDEIRSDFPALKQMEQTLVNVDELDYLAKRLDSFADYEVEQFQAMANKLELHGVDELINLTFCAQEVTVITDFSKLDEVGKAHYLTMNGGCAPVSEVESLNGHALAADLIDHNVGYVTRFGVVYPNEMELSQIYKGRSFPTYCYEASLLEIEMVPKFEPEDTANITNFLLPMHPEQIERTMLRAGITNSDDMQLRFQGSLLPDAIDVALDMEHEGIADLNDMCIAIEPLSREDIAKLGVVVSFAKPEYASEIKHLAENLELFDYAPGIRTPEDYGKYMIQESGHFEYDENLDEYYDYARYGQERMDNEQGFFGDSGYVAYHGELGLDELMADDPCTQALGGMEMG